MNPKTQIKNFIASLDEPKRSEFQEIHKLILKISPDCKLWFDTGVNEDNKAVTNPTIGYGDQTLKYADGKTRQFFRIGVSSNKTGISVYILGLKDKKYLAKVYDKKIGKAKVTGYCIRFNSLKDIKIDVLEDAIRFRLEMKDL